MQMTGYELLAFQSALPRGERQDWPTHLKKGFDISIRAPARGATVLTDETFRLLRYFNPRSREGSDHMRGETVFAVDISIRAPARGATQTLF